MKTLPEFLRRLMLLSLVLVFSAVTHAQSVGQPGVKRPITEPKVILYDGPNFGEPSRSYGIGNHRLLDFNDVTSSIKVPADLVAIVYEHSEDAGGYGSYVDFLEDQPDLAQYNLDNKISHLKIIKRKTTDSAWVRNRKLSGKFKEGRYEVGILPPTDLPPLVAKKPGGGRPPQDPRPEPPTSARCTITGRVLNDKPEYGTRLSLHYPNGSLTSFSAGVVNGQYTILNVPEGTYEVRGKGTYPRDTTPSGRPTGLGIFSEDSQKVTCQGGQANPVNFKIDSIEG